MNRKRLYVLVGVLFLACFGLVAVYLFNRERSSVVLTNVGDSDLHDVVIYLGTSTYSLGEVASGSQANTTVHVNSACGIEIEFTDKDGVRKKTNAVGYFAPGVTSDVEVQIDANGVRQLITKDQRVSWFTFLGRWTPGLAAGQ